MAHYLLSVHMVEGEGYGSEEEMQQAFKDVDALNQEIKDTGAWVFAGGLEQPETATVVGLPGVLEIPGVCSRMGARLAT